MTTKTDEYIAKAYPYKGLTPLHLQILLHYHVSPEPYSKDNKMHRDAPATVAYTGHLIERGLIKPLPDAEWPNGFGTTDRGRVLAAHLCETLLPRAHWIVDWEDLT